MDDTEVGLFRARILEIYDAVCTALVGVMLLLTTPLAIVAYSRLLSARQFRSNYSIRMVVLNGATELLNCFLFTFAFQLTTFAFASPFYAFIMRFNLVWVLASVWAFVSILAIHTHFYVAITRLSALIPAVFRKINSPIIFLICTVTSIIGTVPMILDISIINSFNYVQYFTGESQAFLPYSNRTALLDICNAHSIVMSSLTLFANLLLSLTLFRKSREIATITSSRRSKQEQGLMITSIVSYLFYMVFFVNSYIANTLEWAWSAFSQFLFLGIACHSPFWCLMLFSGSIRATVMRSKTTTETRTAVHSFTVQQR